MPIQATCQQCGASLPVPEQYAGQSVRCGGCRGVVKVPVLAQSISPVEKSSSPPSAIPRARPVAKPVLRKDAEAENEPPPVKARTTRRVERVPDDETPSELELPEKSERPRARPLAKKKRESIFTASAAKWLFCFIMTGVIGLGVLAYASWGKRKNNGTALTPAVERNR